MQPGQALQRGQSQAQRRGQQRQRARDLAAQIQFGVIQCIAQRQNGRCVALDLQHA